MAKEDGTFDMFGDFSEDIDLCSECIMITDMYESESSYSIILDEPNEKHALGAFCFPNFSKYCQSALKNIYGTMLSARSHGHLLDPKKLLSEEDFVIHSHIPLREDVKRGIFIVPFNNVISDSSDVLKMRREVDIGNQKTYLKVRMAYLRFNIYERSMSGTGRLSLEYEYHEEKYKSGIIRATSREFSVSEILRYS